MSRLIEYLPEQYRNSSEIIELQRVFEKWVDKIHFSRDDLFAQFHVSTATWGLSVWEKAVGLEVNVSLSIENRRARVKSKLRGIGNATKARIANAAESVSGCEVKVVEHFTEYSFDIIIYTRSSDRSYLDDLMAAIEEIKPAHLAFRVLYESINTHEYLSGFKHGTLAAYTHEQLRHVEIGQI